MDSATFVRLSRMAAQEALISARLGHVAASAFYVVWQAKILKNWKLLLSTDVVRGVYVEVTFNGDKDEFYVAVYEKALNMAFSLDALREPTMHGGSRPLRVAIYDGPTYHGTVPRE